MVSLTLPTPTLPTHTCSNIPCQKAGDKRCGRCQKIYYCSVECQQKNWGTHRTLCEKKIERISLPDQSVKERIAALRQIPPKDLAHFDKLQNAMNKLGLPEDTPHLKKIPENDTRELLSLLTFTDENVCGRSLHDQFGTVPGVKILSESDCIPNDPNDCACYVFGKENWYSESRKKLFSSYEETIEFLKTQGYTPTSNPQVGDIIAYSTAFFKAPPGIAHYGRISKIGDPIYVHSKWGYGHVFEHPLHVMPTLHGSAYTVLTLNKAASSDTPHSV